MRYMISAAAVAAALLSPLAMAQTVSGIAHTNAAGETTTVFSVQPRTQVSATDYVKMTADALNYRMAASALAARKAERGDVKAYAKADMASGKKERDALYAAPSNKDRKIARPTTAVSSQYASSLELLKKSGSSFDNLYLTQMAEAAPAMWALQKGYATTGSDPALKQVAMLAVPSLETGYTAARGLTPTAVAAN
jgi:putative membrane protein